MSGLKRFLDRRAEGIAREKAKKKNIDVPIKNTETKVHIDKDYGFIETEQEIEETEQTLNLTDDEFWDISNQFNKEIKNNEEPPSEVLQKILKNYTLLKIEQFGKRYTELNS